MEKRFLTILAAVFFSAAFLKAQTMINGTGATFIYPMFSR